VVFPDVEHTTAASYLRELTASDCRKRWSRCAPSPQHAERLAAAGITDTPQPLP
jgi:hypothetical protein